jgi:hypothetical protein
LEVPHPTSKNFSHGCMFATSLILFKSFVFVGKKGAKEKKEKNQKSNIKQM